LHWPFDQITIVGLNPNQNFILMIALLFEFKQATGQFISIEQKEKLRNRPLLWVKAIEKAVPLESSPKLK
jgi:hypothetical protein